MFRKILGPKLVKFSNGKYGVRVGFFPFYGYLDLISPGFWWGKNAKYFYACLGSRELATRRLRENISPKLTETVV